MGASDISRSARRNSRRERTALCRGRCAQRYGDRNDARCRPATLTIEHLMPGDGDAPHDYRAEVMAAVPGMTGVMAPVALSFCASPTLRSAEPFLPKSWHG